MSLEIVKDILIALLKLIIVDICYSEIVNVQDSRKFKVLAFYKALDKSDTVFTSVLTLVSLKGNRRQKIYRYFYSNWYFIFG